ncbi:uncharacterized protein [Apostichopus japonicus]|uniref:uncharacterized protein isoform X1 n=1 Tax=Stichopus japonicus TaxID=307972 RepID=UPI003AB6DFEB
MYSRFRPMLSARDGQVNGDYKANVIPDKEKEWPSSFWLLLKVLGLFYYESAVTERKCFPCHAKKFMEERSRNQIKAMDMNIDYLVLAYELESKREDEDEETKLLLSTNQNDDEEEEGEQNAVCTACESLWWNCDGVAERYTDKTIGFRRWYHKRDKFLSTAWLLCALCLLVYGLYLIIPRLFAKPDQILHLILRMTFYCAIAAPILLLFCSKIRSCFKLNVRKLGWASSLNLRYLIRRAQILDLPKRGLPGKPFLFICICLPTTVSAYRFLGLFYHERIVTERKCFSCNVENITKRQTGNRLKAIDGELDYLILAYEADGDDIDEEKKWLLEEKLEEDQEENCDVCESLWWNCDRLPERYTEEEIGVKRWCLKWNRMLSTTWLLFGAALLMLEFCTLFPRLYAQPDKMLQLLNILSLFIAITIPLALCLCSKIRSYFKSGVPKLNWASSLNIRYLIKRAQLLDLPNRGLPGKLFLFQCISCPVGVAIYRTIIFVYIGECWITLSKGLLSFVGVVFMFSLSVFVYLLYFIRVSFQCHFKLLLAYIKELECDAKRCKGVIMQVAADFSCYRRLCEVVTILMFPATVLAIVSNLTWDYIVFGTCVMEDEISRKIQQHIMILAWLEIITACVLYPFALGGLKVHYIWDDFTANLLLMKCKQSHKNSQASWKEILFEVEYLLKGSYFLVITIFGTVTGIYMGFHFGNQNVAVWTAACNGTYVNYSCR